MNCNGSRALIIDERESADDTGELLLFPLSQNLHTHDPNHPDHELEKKVEALIDWLRMVSLMDQLTVVDAAAIRAAIARTNFMVENRVQASRSIKFKKTRNIMTENVNHPLAGAKIVSLAPELSLATIGTRIPVIEMPTDMPYPTLKDMAFILTLIGQMVINRPVPVHTIVGLGDDTKAIPNTYKKGKEALQYCEHRLEEENDPTRSM